MGVLLALLIAVPLMVLVVGLEALAAAWAINALFGAGIPYTFQSLAAMAIILFLVQGCFRLTRKSD